LLHSFQKSASCTLPLDVGYKNDHFKAAWLWANLNRGRVSSYGESLHM
jgi:hypothetical protein